jgi:hypothetical protein
MDGDDRVRFCRECNRNVYNLSAMRSAESGRFFEGQPVPEQPWLALLRGS